MEEQAIETFATESFETFCKNGHSDHSFIQLYVQKMEVVNMYDICHKYDKVDIFIDVFIIDNETNNMNLDKRNKHACQIVLNNQKWDYIGFIEKLIELKPCNYVEHFINGQMFKNICESNEELAYKVLTSIHDLSEYKKYLNFICETNFLYAIRRLIDAVRTSDNGSAFSKMDDTAVFKHLVLYSSTYGSSEILKIILRKKYIPVLRTDAIKIACDGNHVDAVIQLLLFSLEVLNTYDDRHRSEYLKKVRVFNVLIYYAHENNDVVPLKHIIELFLHTTSDEKTSYNTNNIEYYSMRTIKLMFMCRQKLLDNNNVCNELDNIFMVACRCKRKDILCYMLEKYYSMCKIKYALEYKLLDIVELFMSRCDDSYIPNIFASICEIGNMKLVEICEKRNRRCEHSLSTNNKITPIIYHYNVKEGDITINQMCSICHENNSNCETNCKHIYCRGCIEKASKTNTQCPTCRKNILYLKMNSLSTKRKFCELEDAVEQEKPFKINKAENTSYNMLREKYKMGSLVTTMNTSYDKNISQDTSPFMNTCSGVKTESEATSSSSVPNETAPTTVASTPDEDVSSKEDIPTTS
jgi:hypothetical protein